MISHFVLDESAFEELFRTEDSPVGKLVEELSERAALIARGVVHVRPGTPRSTVWTPRSTAWPRGYTKASIHVHGPVRGRDWIYGGVNAAGNPGFFLEHPAEQMYQPYPFLTTGLDSLGL